ncbi:50S ribosomal protein L22 [Candidatus Gracilibacteria bacterium]|nr:MAG: 50S ribosomal protein L22 [Candidatus Gracilibacteria bacterium]
MRVIAEVIKGNDASEALNFLKFAPKKGAKLLHGVLKSAVQNAVNNDSQKLEDLKIGTLIISKGMVFKRGNPVSKGRMHPILKRTSNVKLELQVK